MDPKGLQIYKEYGGEQAVEMFLGGFAKQNPVLAEMTVKTIYADHFANPILSYFEKAACVVASFALRGDVPGPYNFHKGAFLLNGGTEQQVEQINRFIIDLNEKELEKLGDVLGAELAALAAISACGSGGSKTADKIPMIFAYARQHKVPQDKVLFVINMMSCYAGFPVAIATSTAYQNFLTQ